MFRGPKYGWRYVKSSGDGFFIEGGGGGGEGGGREWKSRIHPGKVQTTASKGGIFLSLIHISEPTRPY